VDEDKLLRDIERLLKRNIRKDVLPGYEPDPTIKAEPIQNGRGRRSQCQAGRFNALRQGNVPANA
jgi:ATP-dependent RNA helicase RhlE